jgi:hypothetical protein
MFLCVIFNSTTVREGGMVMLSDNVAARAIKAGRCFTGYNKLSASCSSRKHHRFAVGAAPAQDRSATGIGISRSRHNLNNSVDIAPG